MFATDNTISEVLSFIRENDVKFIRLTFCDLNGVPKNVSIMPGELERAFTEGIRFEQQAVEGFENVPHALYLKPDAGTVSALPWRPAEGRVVRFFCDIVTADGAPYEGCARSLLRRSAARAARLGLSCQVGTECEFYLFKTDGDGGPSLIPHDYAGYADIYPLDRGENVRREICLTLEEMGLSPESSHHEAGPGQNEVDFRFSDVLSAADNLLAFRAAVKAIAGKHGLYASFLPKPLPGECGSGMHLNLSLVRDGKNIIHAADGLHDPASESFIEGVLREAPGITAFLNPLPGSYDRLRDRSVPRRAGWSKDAASPQILYVPPALGEEARVELRSPDPCCNPYLAFALILEAGLQGVRQKLPLRPADSGGAELPGSLPDAVRAAENSALVAQALPPGLSERYFRCKREQAARQPAAGGAMQAPAFFHSY